MEAGWIRTDLDYDSELEFDSELEIEIKKEISSDSPAEDPCLSDNVELVEPKRVERSTTLCSLISLTEDFMRLFNYLKDFGLLVDSYKCPFCDQTLIFFEMSTKKTQDGYMWCCRKCDVWRGLRKGTWFEKSDLSIRLIILLTYFFCWKSPLSFVCHELKVSRKTVVTWMEYCGEVCSDIVKKWGKVGGPGIVVQIGETYFSNKYDDRDESNDKLTWVLGALVCEKGGRKFVLRELDKRNKVTLLRTICGIVKKGSEIYLGCLSGYGTLEDLNYNQMTVQHQLTFKACKGDVCTAKVKRLMDEVRCNVTRGRGVVKSLQPYLDEFTWRKSIAENECVFKNFLRNVASLYVPNCED